MCAKAGHGNEDVYFVLTAAATTFVHSPSGMARCYVIQRFTQRKRLHTVLEGTTSCFAHHKNSKNAKFNKKLVDILIRAHCHEHFLYFDCHPPRWAVIGCQQSACWGWLSSTHHSEAHQSPFGAERRPPVKSALRTPFIFRHVKRKKFLKILKQLNTPMTICKRKLQAKIT